MAWADVLYGEPVPLVVAACANIGGTPTAATPTASASLSLSVSPSGVSITSHGATVTTGPNGAVTVLVP
jgi:hypothetical protein